MQIKRNEKHKIKCRSDRSGNFIRDINAAMNTEIDMEN